MKDTGVRDEHGMQPLDDVFSSPDKSSQNGVGEHNDGEEEDESDEEPMDIDESKLHEVVFSGPSHAPRPLTRPSLLSQQRPALHPRLS